MTDWRQPRSLEDFGKPWPAEQRVLDELQTGLAIAIGDPIADPDAPDGFRIPVPDRDAPDTLHIRASFVRWLALGAEEHPLHEKGLLIAGALIVGHGPEGAETRGLDLQGCELAHDLGLVFCRLTDPLLLRNARLQTLFLNGSHFPGLSADRLETRGGVLLRGAKVDGEVRLPGARVDGDLDCTGAKLRNPKRDALGADGLETRGDVGLRGAEVDGELSLVGARVGGDLACTGAKLRNAEGDALSAGRARIIGTFFLRGSAVIEGACHLTAARLGAINDDSDCWPGEGKLVLNRCEYGAFLGAGVDAETRIRWLAKQDPARFRRDFWPQPWEQCAKVFREMGHPADARAVLIDKERRQRADRRAIIAVRLEAARHRLAVARAGTDEARQAANLAARQRVERYRQASGRDALLFTNTFFGRRGRRPAHDRDEAERLISQARAALARAGSPAGDRVAAAREPIPWLWLSLLGRRVWDAIVGAVVGYGHRPERAAVWALAVWLFGTFVFAWANGQGGMMPNNAFVLRSDEWVRCGTPADEMVRLAAPGPHGTSIEVFGLRGDESVLACYRRQQEARDFPLFQPIVYSADTLLPVVEFNQQAYWVPNANVPEGWWGRLYLWLHIAIGWALSLLAIAGFSGLVKTD